MEGGGRGRAMRISWSRTDKVGRKEREKKNKTKEPNRSQGWRRGRGESCTRRRQELGMGVGGGGAVCVCGGKEMTVVKEREAEGNAAKLLVCPSETSESHF